MHLLRNEEGEFRIEVSKTPKKDTQPPPKCPEEVYCAAWAVVLARHAGDGESGDVTFGCATGATKAHCAPFI